MAIIAITQNKSPLQRFQHEGVAYIVCPESGEFEVEVSFAGIAEAMRGRGLRHEVVVSVDGLDVLDGKPASISKRGYVVADGRLQLPGWRLDGDRVAKFCFTAAGDSYSLQSGQGTQNVGCVGVVIFTEQRRRGEMSAPMDWRGPLRGGGEISASLSYDSAPTRGASVGAGFGAAADFRTSTTSFERGSEMARETVYYRTLAWFRQHGITVPLAEGYLGSAWPGDVVGGCVPPAGWRR